MRVLMCVCIVALTQISYAAYGGMMFSEAGDAGDLPATAQVASGSGALDSIVGSLIDDVDVDVFALLLDGGGTFSATTVGLSDVDTRLYLFDSSGLGIYTNDDADVFTLQSTLPAGDALTPVSAGVYFLAITSFDIDPANASGSLFPIPLFPEALLGPTGPGGGSPVTGWDSFGEAGDYKIALTGASFIGSNTAVPEPSSFLAWSLAIATLGLRRR